MLTKADVHDVIVNDNTRKKKSISRSCRTLAFASSIFTIIEQSHVSRRGYTIGDAGDANCSQRKHSLYRIVITFNDAINMVLLIAGLAACGLVKKRANCRCHHHHYKSGIPAITLCR
jgi:hypothetical protein